MKPLILILLAAVGLQAQTLADAARQERARQAEVKTTRIFTTEDVKSKDSTAAAPQAKPVENSTPVALPAPAPAAVPVIDPVQKWTEETSKLRTQVRDLMDQDTATLLEMNAASAQINAPVTTQSAKNQAQKTLGESQQKLVGIRAELAKALSQLQERDLAGPALPQK